MDITFKDIALLLVGAILGYIPAFIPWYKKYRLKAERSKWARLLQPWRVANYLNKYHAANGTTGDLFESQVSGEIIRLPFFVKEEWQYFQKEDIRKDVILEFNNESDVFVVDGAMINRKIRMGQTLFNEPTLYIDEINATNAGLKVKAKKCMYFELITTVSRLEEETVHAIEKNKWTDLPIRDRFLKSATLAEKKHPLPFSVGCVVLVAFKEGNSYKAIIQRRSSATATYGGYLSVIPSYGLAPALGGLPDISLTFYNFIKEFAEELYDQEALIQQMANKRGEYNWFLGISEIKMITDSFERGESELIFTGFGIDLLNGTNTLSYLCLINDEDLGKKIRNLIVGNWETEASSQQRALKILDIFDGEIIQNIKDKNFHFGSAYCIMRAHQYLKQRANEQ